MADAAVDQKESVDTGDRWILKAERSKDGRRIELHGVPQSERNAPETAKKAPDTVAKDTRPQKADGDSSSKKADGADDEHHSKINRKTIIIASVVAAVLLIGGLTYYLLTKNVESTDDAQVAGNSVMIAPKISGKVSAILVNDNQLVHKGDIIFKIDDRDYVAARDKAKATLGIAIAQRDGAIANKDFAQSNLRRANSLTDLSISAQNREQISSSDKSAAATLDQGEAQIKQAEADLATAELNLSYTEIRAPYDGWVTQRNAQVGSYVQVGQSMAAVVSPDIWIIANFKENQLDRMRAGQEVRVKVDAFPNLRLKGHVDTFQMGTGSVFTAFPAQNATGNFVKIVQRVPVKLIIDSGMDPNLPLPLGLSVVPSVYLK